MKEAENVGKELVREESEEKNDVALPTSDDVSENEIGKSSVSNGRTCCWQCYRTCARHY